MDLTTKTEFERKRYDAIAWMRVVVEHLRNSYRAWVFFTPNLILGVVGSVANVIGFYYLGKYVAPSMDRFVAEYNGGYVAFLLTGVALNAFTRTATQSIYKAYSEGYWLTHLDAYAVHPMGVSAYVTGAVLYDYLMSAVIVGIYVVLGVWLFGVKITLVNWATLLEVAAVSTVALTGIGLVAASCFGLLNCKTSNPVTWLVEHLVNLTSGVYFPIAVLPKWSQRVAALLPQTHAYHAMRRVALAGAGIQDAEVIKALGALAILIAAILPAGLWLFRASIRRAERTGDLSRWT
ncbi:MAG: ABC transporter permease [Armatimonadota bacterium]